MNKYLSFMIWMIISLAGYSQSKIDSLISELDHVASDSLEIYILYGLFQEYQYKSPFKAEEVLLKGIERSYESDQNQLVVEGLTTYAGFLSMKASYDSAIETYQRALSLADKIQYHKGYSDALIGLGDSWWHKGELKKALDYQQQNISFSESINDQDALARSYNNLGNINNDLGEYTKAMQYYTQAAEIFERLGNQRNASVALTNVGVIHQRLNNHHKAISYYLRSDSIFRKLEFDRGISFIASRLATVYKNLGEYEKSLKYSEQALKGFEKLGGRSDIGEIKHNIGNLYFEQDEYSKALPYYLEARAINLEVGDSASVGFNDQSIGATYFQLGKYDQALKYLNEALNISKSKGATLTIMDSYETLASVYFGKRDFEKAYESLQNFIDIRDSLYTIEKRDLATEIEAKYQNESKQRAIDLLEAENELQQLQIDKRRNERNGLIILSILILIGFLLLINQYRIKQATNKQLKELDRIKSTFFENLSHEFRTPLSLIIAPLKDRMKKDLPQVDKQLLETVLRNAESLDELIKQLLDLAKMQEGAYKLHEVATEASHFFRVIAASYQSLASSRGTHFVVNMPDEECWVELDRGVLQQICNNLLGNAFKFTPDDGTIRFEIEYDSDLKILVSDTGSGIAADQQARIFDRFYQVEGPRATGTGIGLALTKELVSASEGKITLQSAPNQGTSFTVRLPLKSAEPVDQEVALINNFEAADFQIHQGSYDEKKPNILIVEDNPDLRLYLAGIFEDNFNLQTAMNGLEGRKIAKKTIPDLIISDIMMEQMDGLELCESLKADLETDHIPVILLTARADQPTKLKGLSNGADAYILKPFESEELRVIATNLILQREKLRAKYRELSRDDHAEDIEEIVHPFILQCEEVVQQHLADESFSTDDFAREVGMSRMQVHRKLKAMTDLSATAFIRHYRLKIARTLLQKGEPVSQVAYAVGFSSLAYFTKSFKETYGSVPSETVKNASI